jgi:hypothetical protein
MDSQQESPPKKWKQVTYAELRRTDWPRPLTPYEKSVQYDPRKRIEKIQVWSPHDCELMGIAAGGPALEKTLHKDFAADRHRGEWFRLTERLQAEIDRLCEPPTSSV